MRFSFLIQGFGNYLENLEKISNKKYNIGTDDTSIFMYSQEFQNYLKDELGANNDISSMNITDLLNMDIVNGQIVNADSTNNASINDILNDLFNDKSVIETLDKTNDGKLDENEINEFLNNIKGLDENNANISLNDIFAATQAIQDGTYGNIEQTPSAAPEIPEAPAATDESSSAGSTDSTDSTGSTGSTKSGGSKSPSGSTDSTNTSGTDTLNSSNTNIDNLSLEELEAKKTEKEGELKTVQNAVDEVYSGENANVKAAQEDADKAKETYDKALEEDEQVSQELKDKKAENDTKIAASETKINSLESDINSKENEITAQNSVIASDNSNIAALESALSSLNSQSSDDEKTKSEIATKKASVQSQLETARTKLREDEQKLTDLKNEKSDLETDLANEKEILSGLETEKAAIEEEILKTCKPETKEAMEKYNTAKANIETVKTEELSKAKEAVTAKQAELDEINNQINVKRAEKTKSENSVNSLDNPEQLYNNLGLKEQGLNYDVFKFALEGYKNLEDKGNGRLAIFDPSGNQQCYIIDMKNQKFLYSTKVLLGKNGMGSSIEAANRNGSGATLSGYVKVGDAYKSSKHWNTGLNLYGLEKGINDNIYSKRCVIHYVKNGQGTTLGCLGIPPVLNSNGTINQKASIERNMEYFPKDTIIFTYPGKNREEAYRKLSKYC